MNALNDSGAIKGLDAREDGVYITYVPSSGADSVVKKLGSDISFSIEVKARVYMNGKPDAGMIRHLTYRGDCTVIDGEADLNVVSNDSAFQFPNCVSQHAVIESVRIYNVQEI